MLKVRLNGKQEEIEKFLDLLKKQSTVDILYQSDFYKDRGNTIYFRKYLDVELKDKKYTKLDFNNVE